MKLDIIRAWKDEAYRRSLSQEQQALLPANPAGELELSDAELQSVHGADGEGGTTIQSQSTGSSCIFSGRGACISGFQADSCIDN